MGFSGDKNNMLNNLDAKRVTFFFFFFFFFFIFLIYLNLIGAVFVISSRSAEKDH